jgi:hypothetical protein
MTPLLAPPSPYEQAHRAYAAHLKTCTRECRFPIGERLWCVDGLVLLRRADALSWRDMGRGGR